MKKIFPLYEFLSSPEKLFSLLNEIDKKQPVSYSDCLRIVSNIIGKRKSRTKITFRNLRSLGFIKGDYEISLSWETQMYLDMNRNLSDLVLYFVYKNKELFELCKIIYNKDPQLTMSNPEIVRFLKNEGYTTGKIRSETEKIYAIKRVISFCVNNTGDNPFHNYEEYMMFLKKFQYIYYKLSKTQNSVPIEIEILERNYLDDNKNVTSDYFVKMLTRIYVDPIYSTFTSFSTVIKKFAKKKYYRIIDQDFYYFEFIRKIDEVR